MEISLVNKFKVLRFSKKTVVWVIRFSLIGFLGLFFFKLQSVLGFFQNVGKQGTLSNIGFSAFLGAFFAFLFDRFAGWINRIHERKMKHFNSLVLLDSQLNNYLTVAATNLFTFPKFREAIGKGQVYWATLETFKVDESHYINLLDIDLINSLFQLHDKANRFNSDSKLLKGSYKEIKNAFISRKITQNDYLLNCRLTIGRILLVEEHLKEFNEEVKNLLAKVRLQIQVDKPITSMFLNPFLHSWGKTISEKNVECEKKILEKEMDDIGEESRTQIERIDKKVDEQTIQTPTS